MTTTQLKILDKIDNMPALIYTYLYAGVAISELRQLLWYVQKSLFKLAKHRFKFVLLEAFPLTKF